MSIIRVTFPYSKPNTYEGTIEEFVEYFSLKGNIDSEKTLRNALDNQYFYNHYGRSPEVSVAARRSRSHYIVADLIETRTAKLQAKREKEELVRKIEKKAQREIAIRKAIETASRIEAGHSVMPGIFQPQFVITEINEETLDYVRQQGLDLLLTHTSVIIPKVDTSDLSCYETSSEHYEHGDRFAAEYEISGTLNIEPEFSVSNRLILNSEF